MAKKINQCPSCFSPLTLSHTESVFGIYNHTYNVYKCKCGYVSSLIEDDELEISNINGK